MTDKPRVVLIDLSAIYWTHFHVSSESGVRAPRAASLESIRRIAGEEKGHVAICCDSGRSFRKEISGEYKANREKQAASAYAELDTLKARLRADGYLLWEADGFEADDVIATACDKARTAGHEVRIATSDKDMFQLLGPGVDVLRTHTWQVVGVKEFTEKYKIRPVQFADWLALKGDASDNIPGCDGCGDKWASDLLLRFETLPKLYAALDAGKADLPPRMTEKLIACRANVDLSRRLVELNYDAPIKFEDIYEKREPKPPTERTALPHERIALDAIKEADEILAEAESAPETAIAVVAPAGSVTALSLREMVTQKKLIAQCMNTVMKKGEHYGVVPGTNSKPSLFKAGADTLGFMFRLRAEYDIDRAVNDRDYIYYRVRCSLTHIPTGALVATGMGSCNSRESKYVRPAPKTCPKCNGAFIIVGRPEYEKDPAFKGGFVCLASRGGCGAKYKPNDEAITGQQGKIAEPSDLDNTILKMAMKRSRVDATLTGTSAGDFFTQDLEDLEGRERELGADID